MVSKDQFPSVHWIWKGAISFVYEVHHQVVVKVPKKGEFEREQFDNELRVYEIFSRDKNCPSIVQCILRTSSGIFLEYMRGEAGHFPCPCADQVRRVSLVQDSIKSCA